MLMFEYWPCTMVLKPSVNSDMIGFWQELFLCFCSIVNLLRYTHLHSKLTYCMYQMFYLKKKHIKTRLYLLHFTFVSTVSVLRVENVFYFVMKENFRRLWIELHNKLSDDGIQNRVKKVIAHIRVVFFSLCCFSYEKCRLIINMENRRESE